MNTPRLQFPPIYPVSLDELPGHVRDEFAEVHFEKNTFAANDKMTIARRQDGIDLQIERAAPGSKQITIYLDPGSLGGQKPFIKTKGKKKKVQRANINGMPWLYGKFKLEEIHEQGDEASAAAVSGFVILSN